MTRELPYVTPVTETYQGLAFIQGIILATENVKDAYFNHYHQLVCNNTGVLEDVSLNLDKSLWDDYRLEGTAEMDLYNFKNMSREYIVDFLKERIDQDIYILCYQIDEFYLSYTTFYQKMHHDHDLYIFGYDDESRCFIAMAYSVGRFIKLNVPYEEVVDALYNQEDIENASFCTFRPCIAVHSKADGEKILKDYNEYFNPELVTAKELGKCYGTDCYNALIWSLMNLYERENVNSYTIDMRAFRMLWEHKKIMHEHFEKLYEMGMVTRESVDFAIEAEKQALLIFNLMIKYSVTGNKAIIQKMIKHLEELKEYETKGGALPLAS